RHVKSIFNSQPARKLGHHAVGALKEAFMHAITQKVDNLHNRLSEKILPKEGLTPENTPIAEEMMAHNPKAAEEIRARIANGEMPPAYEESERMTPANLDHEDITGTGLRRKRRAPVKRRAPAKRQHAK